MIVTRSICTGVRPDARTISARATGVSSGTSKGTRRTRAPGVPEGAAISASPARRPSSTISARRILHLPTVAGQLSNLADHCGQTEREAEEAEKESVEQKRVEYYADQLRKGHTGPYRAHIVRFLKKGLIVELEESLQRGLVAFSGITDDFYRLNEERTRAVGRRGKKRMHIGEAIDVLLVKVDTARRWLDFQFADERRTGSRDRKGRKGSKGGTKGRPSGKKGSRGNKKGRPSKSRRGKKR